MGGATVTLAEGDWPDSLSLCLHLAGLEGFEISNGEVTLGVSVLVRVDSLRILRWRRAQGDDTEIQVEPHDRDWSRVRVLDGSGQPTGRLPLEDGHLAIDLPPKFAGTTTRALEISWVDFYRR
jgi:hypothetical protein